MKHRVAPQLMSAFTGMLLIRMYLLEATVILGDEACSIDSVLYMKPLFKVGDIMCLKEKQSQELDPFRLTCIL